MEVPRKSFLEKKEKGIEEGKSESLYVTWHDPGTSTVRYTASRAWSGGRDNTLVVWFAARLIRRSDASPPLGVLPPVAHHYRRPHHRT